MIGRHVGRHIPGTPNVIADNMPGVGGVIAANHLANTTPRDGTLICNLGGPIILEQLFGTGVQFDLAKFRYLAVPAPETYGMVVTRKPGITWLEDLLGPRSRQLVVGGIPGSTVEHGALLVRNVVDANVKVVSGYKGTSDVRLPWSRARWTGSSTPGPRSGSRRSRNSRAANGRPKPTSGVIAGSRCRRAASAIRARIAAYSGAPRAKSALAPLRRASRMACSMSSGLRASSRTISVFRWRAAFSTSLAP